MTLGGWPRHVPAEDKRIFFDSILVRRGKARMMNLFVEDGNGDGVHELQGGDS
jgi:hypothetical protein